MLLGAEEAPKEANGVGGAHDGGVVVVTMGAELGQYIFGGFAGAGDGTGFKVSAALLPISKGGFDEP
jgi:hypothetical protein